MRAHAYDPAYSLDGGAPKPLLLTNRAQNLDVIEATPQAAAAPR